MSSNDNQHQIQDETHLTMSRSPSDSETSKSKSRGGKGRRKIDIKYIDDKTRRQITFSKRKAGLMKKAYELSTLTGTQILVLVTSETGHVYTFATKKFQPFITDKKGKTLIQQCLNAPEIVGEQGEQDETDVLEDPENQNVESDKDVKKEMFGGQLFTDFQRYPRNVNQQPNLSQQPFTQIYPQQMGQIPGSQPQYFQTIPMMPTGHQHGTYYEGQKDS